MSALTAGIFTTAQADITVSGSSVIAYQSSDSDNNTRHGGSASFGLSTTTDSGMTVSSGAGITFGASDTTSPAKAASDLTTSLLQLVVHLSLLVEMLELLMVLVTLVEQLAISQLLIIKVRLTLLVYQMTKVLVYQ